MVIVCAMTAFAIAEFGAGPTMAAFTIKEYNNGNITYFSETAELFAKLPIIESVQVITGLILLCDMCGQNSEGADAYDADEDPAGIRLIEKDDERYG